MKIYKKAIVFSIATCISLTPVSVFAENTEGVCHGWNYSCGQSINTENGLFSEISSGQGYSYSYGTGNSVNVSYGHSEGRSTKDGFGISNGFSSNVNHSFSYSFSFEKLINSLFSVFS